MLAFGPAEEAAEPVETGLFVLGTDGGGGVGGPAMDEGLTFGTTVLGSGS